MKFQSIQSRSLILFFIYKIVETMDIYKSLNINIGTVMKNPEMTKFVPDNLKAQKMCKNAVKFFFLNICS